MLLFNIVSNYKIMYSDHNIIFLLSFLRNRSSKSARLKQVAFNREAVNTLPEAPKAEEKVESTEEA